MLKICEKTQTVLYAMLGKLNQRLLERLSKLARENPGLRDEMMEYTKQASKSATETESGNLCLPSYYRKLWVFRSNSGKRPFKKVIGNLLDNDLVLGKAEKAGEGEYEDYFLCSTLDDDAPNSDFPWDSEQEDW